MLYHNSSGTVLLRSVPRSGALVARARRRRRGSSPLAQGCVLLAQTLKGCDHFLAQDADAESCGCRNLLSKGCQYLYACMQRGALSVTFLEAAAGNQLRVGVARGGAKLLF